MNEATRTLVFAGVAAVSVTVAAVTHFATQPADFADDQLIGQEFYPEFDDPTKAVALEVSAYDEDTATVRTFEVKLADGQWVIPSHHNYPADAKDRLEKTAASVVGITRDALASRLASAHEEYGVIQPDDKNAETLLGRGQRIRLVGPNDEVLADYIIGKKVERGEDDSFHQGPDEDDDAYYVRRPDDSATYIARLDIDLSARFADWIESDLLQLDSGDLVELVVDKYTLRDRLRVDGGAAALTRELEERERNRLTREKSFDPWKLDGLVEDKEEVDTDNVRKLVNGLDDLKIVGVRPKPPGIGGDLSIDPNYVKSRTQLQLLQEELESKGFIVVIDPDQPTDTEDPKFRLAARNGELIAATNEGVVYTLRFGELFTGSEFDVEVGFGSKKDKESNDESADDSSDKEPGQESNADGKDGEKDGTDDGESDEDSDLKKSRYLFVSVHFDEQFIPDKPVKPTEPAKPAASEADGDDDNAAPADKPNGATGEQPDDAATNGDEDNNKDPAGDAEAPQDDEAADSEAGNDDAASNPSSDSEADDKQPKEGEPEKTDADKEAEEAQKKYEEDLKKYEEDLKDYEQKIEDGKERVEELSERFAGWYYVISAESFEDLRLSRADLVKAKEKEADDSDAPDDQPAEAKKPEPQKDTDGDEQN